MLQILNKSGDFWKSTGDGKAVECTDGDIARLIKSGIDYLKQNPELKYVPCSTGNTVVMIREIPSDYPMEAKKFSAIIAKNYEKWEIQA